MFTFQKRTIRRLTCFKNKTVDTRRVENILCAWLGGVGGGGVGGWVGSRGAFCHAPLIPRSSPLVPALLMSSARSHLGGAALITAGPTGNILINR